MSPYATIAFIRYLYGPLTLLGGLILIAGVCLKIYRTANKKAYPSQPKWGEPELLAVIGFFIFALTDIAANFLNSNPFIAQ